MANDNFLDKAKNFFKEFKDYLSARWVVAYGAGAKGSAGKIRQASESIYLNALEKVKVIVDNFSSFSIEAIQGNLLRAKEALSIEAEVDAVAAKRTPSRLVEANNEHAKLKRDTQELTDSLLAVEKEIEDSGFNQAEEQPPIYDVALVNERERLITQYIELQNSNSKPLSKIADKVTSNDIPKYEAKGIESRAPKSRAPEPNTPKPRVTPI